MTIWDDDSELSTEDASGSSFERVLVAVITRPKDWELVQREHWYRIPMARAPRAIAAEYLAFYHTRAFEALSWTVSYYAPIVGYRIQKRRELLPDEAQHPRAEELYYRLDLGPIDRALASSDSERSATAHHLHHDDIVASPVGSRDQ